MGGGCGGCGMRGCRGGRVDVRSVGGWVRVVPMQRGSVDVAVEAAVCAATSGRAKSGRGGESSVGGDEAEACWWRRVGGNAPVLFGGDLLVRKRSGGVIARRSSVRIGEMCSAGVASSSIGSTSVAGSGAGCGGGGGGGGSSTGSGCCDSGGSSSPSACDLHSGQRAETVSHCVTHLWWKVWQQASVQRRSPTAGSPKQIGHVSLSSSVAQRQTSSDMSDADRPFCSGSSLAAMSPRSASRSSASSPSSRLSKRSVSCCCRTAIVLMYALCSRCRRRAASLMSGGARANEPRGILKGGVFRPVGQVQLPTRRRARRGSVFGGFGGRSLARSAAGRCGNSAYTHGRDKHTTRRARQKSWQKSRPK